MTLWNGRKLLVEELEVVRDMNALASRGFFKALDGQVRG